MRSFKSLTEQEILALAISLEEEDARIYDDFAEGLKASYPAQAERFRGMRADEDGHRHRLLELYRQKFGEHIPLLRRQDVKGFVHRYSRQGLAHRDTSDAFKHKTFGYLTTSYWQEEVEENAHQEELDGFESADLAYRVKEELPAHTTNAEGGQEGDA